MGNVTLTLRNRSAYRLLVSGYYNVIKEADWNT